MKILFISNIAGKKVGTFSMASIKAAKKLGWEYHLAANFRNSTPEQMKCDEDEYGIYLHQIDFERHPLNLKNRKAYWQVVELIRKEQIDIIHCNTPVGGLIGRLAGRKCGVKKVIYQAHGFHFYKGAPIFHWLVYYPAERWLAHYTDVLITINKEDFARARNFKLRNDGKVYCVPGVGIDTSGYSPRDKNRNQKRKELGLKEDEIMLISMGDLIERKNYKTSIEAVAKLGNSKIHYFICGTGQQEGMLKALAIQLGAEKRIHFLGFRMDIRELLQAADIFLFSTAQEGLSRSLMEAMASGLPCVASRIRGNVDLMTDGENGFLCHPFSANEFAAVIVKLSGDPDLRRKMGAANMKRIIDFDMGAACNAVSTVYEEFGGGKTL